MSLKGKYFSVTKKIEIAASKQHTAFGSGDLIADWQPIQIPKGSACLKSLTMLWLLFYWLVLEHFIYNLIHN